MADILSGLTTDDTKWAGAALGVAPMLGSVSAGHLTVALFQAGAAFATGDSTTPTYIGDGVTTNRNIFLALNQYTIVPFARVYTFRQYRQFGYASMNADGEYTIDYWDGLAWVEWGKIPTRADSWSGFATISEISTKALRFTATTLDSAGSNRIGELEIKF